MYSLIATVAIVIVHFLIDGCITLREGGRVSINQLTRPLRNYTLASINMGLMAISILRSGLVATIVPLYAAGNLGLTTIALGSALTVFALANFMTLLPAGSLSDRFGRRPFLFASLFLSGLCVLAIPFSKDLIAFTAIMAAMGGTLGLSGAIGAWVTDVSPPGDLGGAMGLFRTMGDLGSIVGPILVTSFPSHAGLIGPEPFLLTGGVIILSSLPLRWAQDPTRGRAQRG